MLARKHGREGAAPPATALPSAERPSVAADGLHRIVIVGGGAGGLVLATRLGHRLGRRRRARITLIDANLTHVWKPLLHEVAVGTLDSHKDDVIYLGHAKGHGFSFQQGRMDGLDRERKEVRLAPMLDEKGREVIPARTVPYDTLVIAVGGLCNDFGTPGVKEHCMFLDTHQQAEQVQKCLLNACLRAQAQAEPLREGQLHVAIVGAGATGVELAAELHRATRELVAYGLDRIDPERDVKISLIEAGPTVLPALPPRLSEATMRELLRLGIAVHTGEKVVEVTEQGVRCAGGLFVPAEIKVWSAGVKAPDFLKDIAGLETNRLNQLVVDQTLRTTRDPDIYAIGDCAACPQPGSDRPVPPRAQAAYQEAMTLARTLRRRLEGQAPVPFVYKDYGSLVSLSYSSVGNLMGNLLGNVMIEGKIARLTYQSLYKKHQLAVHGFVWVALNTLINFLRRRTEPRLKLH
ncbi:NAD(P)/FAD-dependent oxidoreductase [Benzoatithermus flavus]|uniref:NAD(P)/FAD-dependent oxidoreductase n=1 Tax=Benzoatithermus flavus TaxID=3108223 RepID=A0ABU8XYM4_9PROT